MNVNLREKKLKDRSSLYLDIYLDGKRQYKFLKLYLIDKPRTQEDRIHNVNTKKKAEAIRAKKEVEIIDNHYKLAEKPSAMLFIDYFRALAKQRLRSKGNYGNWDSVCKILEQFFGDKQKRVGEITDSDLQDFKVFILNTYKTKSNTNLSINAASSYFNKVKAALNQAYDERIISEKIGVRVKGIKPEETRREHLSQEEVNALIVTDCSMPMLKNAFLFSVHTGLCWSDINNLRWQNIEFTEENGFRIKYIQQKTGSVETHPIGDIAMEFAGPRQVGTERVFKGLKYSAWNNVKLIQWVMQAGISRHVTFHSARHTYCTLLLTKGVDIYTISSLVGHKHISTTQIYAKVIDQKKIAAAKAFDRK